MAPPPTAAISRIKNAVNGVLGPQIQDLGIHSCRKERDRSGNPLPGNEWSQHAWSHAWDFRVPASFRNNVNSILDRHPDVRWYKDYGDGQYHVDAKPKMTGTPPCAGGSGSNTPDVLNPPQDDGTAQVPVGPTPEGMEDRPGGVREGSLADAATGPLASASDVLEALGDPDTWGRVLLVVAGLVALIVGALILVRDLIPSGRLAGIAAGALKGAA